MRHVLLLLGGACLAQQANADAVAELRFVTCPIYRDADAGKKSGCWLADDPATGIRYDISPAPTKADWNAAVLVEGRAAPDQTNHCGGVVLDPVRVSVLRDQPCTRAMLPAEGFPGRKFVLPERNIHPLYAKRTPAVAPFAVRTFVVPFDYDSDFATYQLSDYYLDQAVAYAKDAGGVHVRITGFADTTKRDISGVVLAEPATLAKDRAERAADWFRLLGVPAGSMRLSWETAATPLSAPAFDGLVGPSYRRVEIRIEPITTVPPAPRQSAPEAQPATPPTGGGPDGS